MSRKRPRGRDQPAESVSLALLDEERRKKSTSISESVQRWAANGSAEDLVCELSRKWEIDAAEASLADFANLALRNLSDSPHSDIDLHSTGEFGLRTIEQKMEEEEQRAIAALYKVKKEDPACENPDLTRRIIKVLEVIYYARKMVLSAFQARLAVHQRGCEEYALSPELDLLLGKWQMRFRWVDQSKCTPVQKLLMYVLDMCMEKGYRKQGDFVMEAIVTPEGHMTHAWKSVCTIEQLVYARAVKKEGDFEQWSNLTSNAGAGDAVCKYLKNCEDPQFPTLTKDRSVFAFRNGVYVARDDRFYAFDGDAGELPDTVVAAKFFDMDFREFAHLTNWRDIPTPHLSSIMQYQQWPADVCDWAMVFFGRLLYNVGEKDRWQVILFLLGAAGAGKSTLADMASKFYDPQDVGTMSNNVEAQFGLWALWDKFLFVGPEIKSDFRIEQAQFQSLVSGEALQIAGKHIKAFALDAWLVPGLLAGNEVPSFKDNQGSMTRRLMVLNFMHAVVNGDMQLGEKLAAEMATILLKCNKAYLEAVERYNTQNIWTVLPAYFTEARRDVAQTLSSMDAFLNSHDVQRAPHLFCSWSVFKNAYKAFCNDNNFAAEKRLAKPDIFRTAFCSYNISTVKDQRAYRGGNPENTTWIVGVDLAQTAHAGLLG